MVIYILYVLLGMTAGAVSGLVGIGGGIIIVPALIYFFGFNQHTAQGTSLLMMLPPIGLLAAWTYYKEGFTDIPAAAILCLGFIAGGWIGAKTATALPADTIEKIFGALLVVVGIKMLFFGTR